MMLWIVPGVFGFTFLGETVAFSVWPVGTPAKAVPEMTKAPITPSDAPIRYLRLRIPLLFRLATP